MNLIKKQTMTYEQADNLLERYYEGLTTGDEEKRLRSFLSQPGLPARYAPEQAIFGYFAPQKSKTAFDISAYKRWASTIAAMLVLAVGLQFFLHSATPDNYAWVNGQRITNTDDVKRQALASLTDVSGNDEVKQSIDEVAGAEIMKQQLEVFSELEK